MDSFNTSARIAVVTHQLRLIFSTVKTETFVKYRSTWTKFKNNLEQCTLTHEYKLLLSTYNKQYIDKAEHSVNNNKPDPF